MTTFEEYEREHNPKMSKTEIIIGLVLFFSFLAYFVLNAIVDCWPLLRSNLAVIFS